MGQGSSTYEQTHAKFWFPESVPLPTDGESLWSTQIAYTGAMVADLTQMVGWSFFGLALFFLGLVLVVLGVYMQFKGNSTENGWIALWVVGIIIGFIGLLMMMVYTARPVFAKQPAVAYA